jgi:hypothetical protein
MFKLKYYDSAEFVPIWAVTTQDEKIFPDFLSAGVRKFYTVTLMIS